MSTVDFLKSSSIFEGLTDKQLKSIVEAGDEKKIKDGTQIFHEGDAGHECYLLIDGRVQISVQMGNSTEQAPVHTVIPGSIFGEFSLVSDGARSATAHTSEECTCFVFTREQFEAVAEKDPQLGFQVTRNLAEILVGRITKTTRELRSSLMF